MGCRDSRFVAGFGLESPTRIHIKHPMSFNWSQIRMNPLLTHAFWVLFSSRGMGLSDIATSSILKSVYRYVFVHLLLVYSYLTWTMQKTSGKSKHQ